MLGPTADAVVHRAATVQRAETTPAMMPANPWTISLGGALLRR